MEMGEQEVWRGRGLCDKRELLPLSHLPRLRYSSDFDRESQQLRQRRENRFRLKFGLTAFSCDMGFNALCFLVVF